MTGVMALMYFVRIPYCLVASKMMTMSADANEK